MRRLVFLLYVLLSVLSMNAQEDSDYRPFIEEGKVWHSCHSDMFGQYHRYCFFDGDTIVGEKKCKKWIQKIEWIQKRPGYSEDNGVRTDCCALYEEDRKIWCFLETASTPVLMFDFGAEVGDTIDATVVNAFRWTLFQELWNYSWDYYVSHNQEKLKIIRKETLSINGKELYEVGFIRINDGSFDYQEVTNRVWEGIGDCRGPVFWTGMFTGDGTRNNLISCTIGDEVLYFDDAAAMYWDVPIPTSISSHQMANGRSAQSDDSHLKKWSNGKIFDLSGRRLAASPAKGVYIQNGKKRAR